METLSMVLSFFSALQNEIKSVSCFEFLITKGQFKRRTVYLCRTKCKLAKTIAFAYLH